MRISKIVSVAAIAAVLAAPAYGFDEDAAKKLAKKSGCLKCHAIDKKKDAPSLKDISAEFKDKSDAKDTFYTHLTTNPMVEVDGKQEKHEGLKTDDEAQIRNVIDWILSL